MNRKTMALATLLTLLLAGCKKNDNYTEPRILNRVIHTSPGLPTHIDTFIYDLNNRLIAIKYLNNNTQYDKTIEYNSQKKLARAVYSYNNREDYSCSFIYNASGQIIKRAAIPVAGFDFAYDESYAYDNLGRVVSDTTFYKQTDSIVYFSTFKYGNDGNIIEENFHNFLDPNNQGKSTYVYDNNPNPFNLPGSTLFYLSGDLSFLSRNNIIEIRPWWSTPIVNQIEYQSNGLPKKIITTDPNGPMGIIHYTSLIEYRN